MNGANPQQAGSNSPAPRLALLSIIAVLFLLSTARSISPATAHRPAPAQLTQSQATASYGRLPLSFEPNLGQAPGDFDFVARGSGYSLGLSSDRAILSLRQGRPADDAQPDATPALNTTIGLRLLGAATGLRAQPEQPLAGTMNYFTGNDRSAWHTGIPTFGQARYLGIYPGIDAVYYGNQGQLEYDFVLAPGADPSALRLGYEGIDDLSLDADGNLVLQAGDITLDEAKPSIYQVRDGQRLAVGGGYILLGDREAGFHIGEYDRELPLVIDPALVYSTYLGGSGNDEGNGIAVDASGGAYVTGFTTSTNFPTTAGAAQTSPGGGNSDVFVTKLNPAGTALIYSTYLGGSNNDQALGIAVDAAGNALTRSTNFPTSAGAFQATLAGSSDAFVTKLNPAGTALIYSTYLGGSGTDQGFGIAVDAAGNAYVTGNAASTNFPTTAGAFQTTFGGNIDAFIAKLNPPGTALLYSTYLGGSGQDGGTNIAVDAAGNAYVTGPTSSTNFPTTAGAFQATFGGSFDVFVTKLNPTGTGLVYSTYLGGSGSDQGFGIALDAAGNAYITGFTLSTNFPTTVGAFQTTFGGSFDAFVSKLNPTGSTLLYSTYLGGGSNDAGDRIAVDAAGSAYVTGYTTSTNFPTTAVSFQATLAGGEDAFVTKLNPSGTALDYSTYLGGGSNDEGHAIAIDGNDHAYVTGFADSTNFPTTAGVFQTTLGGGEDVFVTKLLTSFATSTATTTTTLTSLPIPSTGGQPVTFTATVTCSGSLPTGTVTFFDGGAPLGTVPLVAGSASFTTSNLALGSHAITAVYSGDGNCATSTSAVLTQVVNPPAPTPNPVPPSDAPLAPGYCAPAVNAPPPGVSCMPVPMTALQNAAAAITFCTSVYSGIATQQACIASLIPNVGGFISLFGGIVPPPKPAPRLPGRYCTNPDGSELWVAGGASCP